MHVTQAPVFHTFVPPHLLERLARHGDPDVHRPARRALELDAAHRTRRGVTASLTGPTDPGTGAVPGPGAGAAEAVAPRPSDHPLRTLYDAHHGQRLPGDEVRAEGGRPSHDASVNRAYDALGATFTFYLHAYGRHSVDGRGLPLVASVHYGEEYDNAFWDGAQMVFGDGDGQVFRDFTIPLDVIGHELTHGVTQYTVNLAYHGQSGALNESVSDVFGSLIKQYALGQTADQADWLIGAGLLAPGVHGLALRSMKAPGTAYDDPALGRDPQPGTMDGFVHTHQDNGGVHVNSGIPNHAFYLLATALGGHAWERAGQIWYDTLTGGTLASDADFAAFARSTAQAALARYGDGEEHRAVLAAWSSVGVRVAAAVPHQGAAPDPAARGAGSPAQG